MFKNYSWSPTAFPLVLCRGGHSAACRCCPDTWIKKERGVYKWYILLTYPIHFLLKPKSCPSAESSTHTVKLFHSAIRHFITTSQAVEVWTKASFIQTFLKQKLRSCVENKECSVVRCLVNLKDNLQGESDPIAGTLIIKWAMWFGQSDALQRLSPTYWRGGLRQLPPLNSGDHSVEHGSFT